MPAEDRQRTRAVERLKALLLRRGNPYGHMMLILLATGCAVFLSSKLLHAAGLLSMAVRYPIAAGLGYLVFMMLVGLWASYQRWKVRRAGNPGLPEYVGHGPYFYGDPFPRGIAPVPAADLGPRRRDGGGWFVGGGGGGDGDGVAILVVLVIGIGVIAALGTSVYVVLEAPALLGEVLLDSALVAGFSRRLRAPQQHWTSGVVRRTWLAAAGLIVCVGLLGFALEQLVPTATTVGEAWTHRHR